MTDLNTTADIITLRKPDKREAARLRQRACRARKAGKTVTAPVVTVTPSPAKPVTRHVTPVTPDRVTAAHQALAPWCLTAAGIGLACVGITMNGWFARSLGSSDIAGWLFLAIGVAADASALFLPCCAAAKWQAHRGVSLAGWVVYLLTFVFALTAGIGFASINIADVTSSRASRTTPAVTAAEAALRDAQGARDRECAGGVGKVCRVREEAVTAARTNLETAMRAVEEKADPQVEAAIGMVNWISGGHLAPSPRDAAMLRLVLLALLPQLGGILLMVGRPRH